MSATRPTARVSLALLLVPALIVAILACSVSSASAAGSPAWSLHVISQPSSFSAADNGRFVCEVKDGGYAGLSAGYEFCDRYSLVLTNVGTSASNGPVTVTDTLPAGLVTSHPPGGLNETGLEWNCATKVVSGREVVTCSTGASVPALSAAFASIEIPVNVEGSLAPGTSLLDEAVVTGGEAATVHASVATSVAAPPEAFAPQAFEVAAVGGAGALDLQAGSHPGAFVSSFQIPSANSFSVLGEFPRPVENVKQIVTDLPPGVLGDALAAPTCSLSGLANITKAEIVSGKVTQCPSSSQVGSLSLTEAEGTYPVLPIYNVTPEHGYPAEFGVYLPGLERAALLYASVVGQGADTHVRVTSNRQDEAVYPTAISFTFYGDPALIDGSPNTPVAFATNPSDCQASGFTSTLYIDSWEHPGSFESNGEPDLNDPNWKRTTSTAPPVTGCQALQFHPTLSAQPTNTAPDSPTGLNVDLNFPQNEDPNGLATPPLKDSTVTLPQGVVLSPSQANGLQACSDEQIELATNTPGSCPQASRIATVTAHTPLLEESLQGQVFLGTPECSPCGNQDAQDGKLARLFIQLHSERYGVTLKLEGHASINPATGQVTATFDNLPQQPVDDLQVHFPEGPRAALSTPSACGTTYTTTSDLTPWSSPQTPDATPSSSFTLSSCASNAFGPLFTAGTTGNQAGSYSPFTLTFSRNDGEQDFSDVEQTLPPGMLAKLAGVPRCGEAEANAGTCSSASRIGSVTAGAGPGSDPFYTSGSIYLTGPYKGGPFGEVVVVQAVAGPFNLGTVVVRGSIRINPTTAQATVVSDPFPTMLAGIPLQIRTIDVNLERAGFTFNATDCTPAAVTGKLVSTQGAGANLSSPYEAVNCASLPFKPVLTASTGGRASKANGATLTVKIASKGGPGTAGEEANIKSVKVDLPIQLPSRLSTLQKACVAKVFEADPANCPSASDVGTATANTPLLGVPLSGPAYLVSHGNEAFPDLEIVLQGEGITLVLDGNTQIKKGITSSTFKTVPDAPISSFELKLPTGKYSILGANVPEKDRYVLCGQSLPMPTAITGQNGGIVKQTTKIAVTNCAKAKAAKKKAKKATKSNRRGK